MIRPLQYGDAKSLASIYNYYILNSIATFEEVIIDEQEMQGRIETHDKRFPWLIYEIDHAAVGYAYAAPWKNRSAYRYSAECSIYIDINHLGKGIGTELYSALFEKLGALDLHTVFAGISLPNEASVAVHEHFGFEKVAHYKEIGFKFNKWIDVGYWQLKL